MQNGHAAAPVQWAGAATVLALPLALNHAPVVVAVHLHRRMGPPPGRAPPFSSLTIVKSSPALAHPVIWGGGSLLAFKNCNFYCLKIYTFLYHLLYSVTSHQVTLLLKIIYSLRAFPVLNGVFWGTVGRIIIVEMANIQ